MAADSAGGHLSVDLLLQPDVIHPSALVLLSPALGLTFTLARTREPLRRDPAIRSSDAVRLLKLSCAGIDVGLQQLVSGRGRFHASMYPGFATQYLQQMRDFWFGDYADVAQGAHAAIGARAGA